MLAQYTHFNSILMSINLANVMPTTNITQTADVTQTAISAQKQELNASWQEVETIMRRRRTDLIAAIEASDEIRLQIDRMFDDVTHAELKILSGIQTHQVTTYISPCLPHISLSLPHLHLSLSCLPLSSLASLFSLTSLSSFPPAREGKEVKRLGEEEARDNRGREEVAGGERWRLGKGEERRRKGEGVEKGGW